MKGGQEGVDTHLLYDGAKTYHGFTLYAPVGAKEIHLIDMNGRLIHTWRLPSELGSHGILLPNSNLLCSVKAPEESLKDFEGISGKLIEVDWDNNIVWEYENPCMHHDFYRSPDGNTFLLKWVPAPNDIAQKVKGGIPGTERQGIMWSDSLCKINSAGDLVWEWIGYEHLDPEIDIICPLCFRNDWTHANSIDVASNGNILMSFMKTNNIAIINEETGDISWRWGGFLKLAHPLDVIWVDNTSVMVLGCGGHIAGSEVGDCEILKIDIGTNNIIWEFKELNSVDFYTAWNGNFHRLPNNNILICEGDSGRIFEVNEDKEIVWEFINPYYRSLPFYGKSNMLFRAFRYGPEYEGLQGNIPGPDKLKKKDMPQGGKIPSSKEEKAIQDRLGALGY